MPLVNEEFESPVEGQLAPTIDRLAGQTITDIYLSIRDSENNRIDFNEIVAMFRTNTQARTSANTIILLALSKLGEYHHSDPDIQEFIRWNFANMNGSFREAVAQMLSFVPFGRSFTERSVINYQSDWVLESLITLDPTKYSFRGTLGEIENVVYRGVDGELEIPYSKGVHLRNDAWLCMGNDPNGISVGVLTYAAWKILRRLQGVAAVFGVRRAIPPLVGYAEDGEADKLDTAGNPVLDSDGLPIKIPNLILLHEQMRKIDTNSVIATSMQNKIESLQLGAGGNGADSILELMDYFERVISLSFMLPETITKATGVGDSNLNTGHRQMLDLFIGQIVALLKEQLIESVCRPLIYYKFREQDDYGDFVTPEENAFDRIALLDALTKAIQGGTFGVNDTSVYDLARETVGVSPLEEAMDSFSRQNPALWGANGQDPYRDDQTRDLELSEPM